MKLEALYMPVAEAINRVIREFNMLLNNDLGFPEVDVSDPNYFGNVAGVNWDDQHWPSRLQHGVYVLLGQDRAEHRIHAYIGKASLTQMVSRIDSHLRPQRDGDGFWVCEKATGKVPLEAIFAIPVPEDLPSGFASALEEFLIEKGIEDLELVNSIGNYASSAE